MRGIATIERQPGDDALFIWLTKRVRPLYADHTNALRIDLVADPQATKKVHAMTRECAVLVTEGSTLDGLVVEGQPVFATGFTPLSVVDLDALVAAADAHQQVIIDAITAYKKVTRSAGLQYPTFPKRPSAADFPPADESGSQRALSVANYAARAWRYWLNTDEERRRRTVQPRTNMTPWIMPEALNDPDIAPVPESLANRFCEQTSVIKFGEPVSA